MANRALKVDEQLSWALRHGDAVRVLVRIPGTSLPPSPVVVRLSNGRRDLEVPATAGTDADAGTLAFEVPQGELGRTAWRMAIQRSPGAPFIQVQARLLAVDGAPVALLPGPVPATRMPAPPVRPPAPPSAARRVAAHLPAPARRALRRAAAAGRHAAEHLQDGSR
jgi:hypothetical protein